MKIGLFFYLIVLAISAIALVVSVVSVRNQTTSFSGLKVKSVNAALPEYQQYILGSTTSSSTRKPLTLNGTWDTSSTNLIAIPEGYTTYRLLLTAQSELYQGSYITHFTSLRNTYSAGFTSVSGTIIIKSMPTGWILNAIEATNNGQSLVLYVQGPNGASITWKAEVSLLRTII
jgi:hypothetical protein